MRKKGGKALLYIVLTVLFILSATAIATNKIDEKQDETTLIANVSKEYRINDLYTELSKRDIKVLSMRNKSNRLEELFVSMVEGS